MKLSFMMESLGFLSLDSPSNHVNPLLSILISCRLNIKFHEELGLCFDFSLLWHGLLLDISLIIFVYEVNEK